MLSDLGVPLWKKEVMLEAFREFDRSGG